MTSFMGLEWAVSRWTKSLLQVRGRKSKFQSCSSRRRSHWLAPSAWRLEGGSRATYRWACPKANWEMPREQSRMRWSRMIMPLLILLPQLVSLPGFLTESILELWHPKFRRWEAGYHSCLWIHRIGTWTIQLLANHFARSLLASHTEHGTLPLFHRSSRLSNL